MKANSATPTIEPTIGPAIQVLMLEFDSGVAVDSDVGARSSFVAVVGDAVIVMLADVIVVKVEAVLVGFHMNVVPVVDNVVSAAYVKLQASRSSPKFDVK